MKDCVWCEDIITGGSVTVKDLGGEYPFHVKCYREYKGTYDGIPVSIFAAEDIA